ncbi:MAG: nucleotidyltransferase family protein [Gemmataceae bacterium]
MLRTMATSGQFVAEMLSGSWRSDPELLESDPDRLAEIAPLLLEGGAGALAWRRLGSARLRNSHAGRRLRQAFLAQAIEVDSCDRMLGDVLRRLRDAGVEPIVIKGWVAARLYPFPSLRPYSDFDVCVDPEQLKTARRVFAETNWKFLSVELHEGVPDISDRPWSEILRRSRLISQGNLRVQALGFEDQLRQFCIHLLRHKALRPLWLCDIAAAIEVLPANFDWAYFLSGDECATEWTQAFLGLACRALGARTSAPPIVAAAEKVPSWLIDDIHWRWGNGMSRMPLIDTLKCPQHLYRVIRHDWLNRMAIAYRSSLSPHCSLPKLLAYAAFQQPMKAAVRIRRIASTRIRKWTGASEEPFSLHLSETSRFL